MTRSTTRSQEIFARAQGLIPGGVNSPVRACRQVGCEPRFLARGEGSRVYDADGNEYLDLVGSWGPLILGHAHPEVLEAIGRAMAHGTTFGAPTELEVEFAAALCAAVPSIERVRAVSSGTEATMSALRLARGFTGRDKIVKIDGAYHGHTDSLLVAAGSGAATLGLPGSAGVTAGAARDTLVVPHNDLPALEAVLAAGDVAAVIVEAIPGNMGCVPPAPDYPQTLRALTAAHGALLVYDEVMTGFRVAYGGAQALHGVTPDLTCLGKIVGGGLPAAAFGGRADVMELLAPVGKVYQAGTLSGNPLAMAAGLKTLELLRRPGAYERLDHLSQIVADAWLDGARAAGIPACVNRVGSMFTLFFQDGPVTDYTSAKRSDLQRFAAFFRGMRARGVSLPPSQFEAAFTSLALSESDVDQICSAARDTLREI
ncbi:MAG: glutamate-1-semialdehyde 2,1-aminomutase [Kofleriaceae bacterium]|nr:glutamate-1-semialdehyde 2,1-aminomutase [Kofleriaceae bacterium]MCL4225762.1 glutamate-1-semialdehyde 2,1-aminomutase [Myxococcales bacterium]